MIYAIAAVAVIIFDQLVKYLVTVNIPLNTGIVKIIPGVISLVNVHNKGAAFGILQNGRVLFILIAFVFIGVVVYALVKGIIKAPFGRWAAVGVLAGAIGNCIDRIMNGYVVDMFKLEFMNYAIFNIADIFISCCGILFCIYIIIGDDEEEEPEIEERSHGGGRRRELSELRRRPAMADADLEADGIIAEDMPRRRPQPEDTPRRRPQVEDAPRRRPEAEDAPRMRPQAEDAPRRRSQPEDAPRRRPTAAPPEDAPRRRPPQQAAPRRREDPEQPREAAESADPFAEWDRMTQAAREKRREQDRAIAARAAANIGEHPAPQKPLAAPPRQERQAAPPAYEDIAIMSDLPLVEESSVPEPAPVPAAAVEPEVPAYTKPASAAPLSDGFSLEDIIAEFK